MRQVSSTRLLWMVVIALCLGGIAGAQTAATGDIEGLVTDTTGAVLPGVTVTVRNMDTNLSREVVTNATGRYRAAALQPGRYEVSVTLSGFEGQPVGNVEVLVGQLAPVDVRMHAAGVTETVTVTEETTFVDTRRTDLLVSTGARLSDLVLKHNPTIGQTQAPKAESARSAGSATSQPAADSSTPTRPA